MQPMAVTSPQVMQSEAIERRMAMAQETPIHAGDRVVITHGPDAKQHRGKVWW